MAIDARQLESWQRAADAFNQSQGGYFADRAESFANTISQDLEKFASKFTSLVGRAPTDAEKNTFVDQFVVPNAASIGAANTSLYQDKGNYITGFIGDTFQKQAEDVASQKLTEQQGQANDLANLFRTQGTQAINSTEQSLLDYQQKLFDRLRPNLITSLQTQGLLNTGGVNQAVAGAQADLATAGTEALREARFNNEQQANAIAFSGASAPYEFQRNSIVNKVPYLQAQSQNALQNNYNTFLSNLGFNQQIALQNNAAKIAANSQPGFLQRMGQNFAGSFGNSAGQFAGNPVEWSRFGTSLK